MFTRPTIDIVVPVYNEASILRQNIEHLQGYLAGTLPYPFTLTIAESGSTDGTAELAAVLAAELPCVRATSAPTRGRGLALRKAWESSTADVVAYVDADLSVSLDAILPLLAVVVTGHSPLAVGTRHAPGSRVTRSVHRMVLSRGLNLLLRGTVGARFTDAQCGLKAGRRDVLTRVMADVQAEHWFFDTELLIVAQRQGLRIHEVPVDCVDDPASSVALIPTVSSFLAEITRMTVRRAPSRTNRRPGLVNA